jgi:GNAT superfamily N-acetyltransferase
MLWVQKWGQRLSLAGRFWSISNRDPARARINLIRNTKFREEQRMEYSEARELTIDGLVELYRANGWSSADKPELLQKALAGSHALVTAWDGERLVGLGNSISDGCLVVYYPHLIVHPEYQGRGIGKEIMHRLMQRYEHFHQQMLVADGRAIDFYRKCGFRRAGQTESMWIYDGNDH